MILPDLSRNTPWLKLLCLFFLSYYYSSFLISLAQIRRFITTDWLVITQAITLTPVPSPFPQRSCLASSSSRSTSGAPQTGTDRSKLMTRLYRWVRSSGVSFPPSFIGCVFQAEFLEVVFSSKDVHGLLGHSLRVRFLSWALLFLRTTARQNRSNNNKNCHGVFPPYNPMSGHTTFIHFKIAHSLHSSRPTQPREMLKEFRPSWEVCFAFCTRFPCMHARAYLYSTNITRLYYIFH